MPRPAVLIAVSAAAAVLPAQAPSRDNAGFGAIYVDAALDPQTGNQLHLGVAVDTHTGHAYVSATGIGVMPPHLIYEFDPLGGMVGSFVQPGPHNATAFGIRDLDFDGQNLLGGSEAGISVFSTSGALVSAVAAANGPQPIVQPIAGPALAALGTIRALAFDPQGNGGNGSLFVGSFGASILECDLAGNVLRTLPNRGWSAYGLAVDPVTRNLWVNATAGGEIAEIDRSTGTPTGHGFAPVLEDAAPGGLSVASGALGHHEQWRSEFLLAELSQGTTAADRLAIRRVHLLLGVPGWSEPVLRVATNGGPPGGLATFRAGDTIQLLAGRSSGIGDGLPCWTILNFGMEAALDVYTDLSMLAPGLGYLEEQRTHNGNSVPPGTTHMVVPHALGVARLMRVPLGMPVQDGDLLRMQSVYFEPASLSGIASTNEANLIGRGMPHGIVVAATGPNSLQSNPATPFWTVASDTTHGHGDITAVEFSFVDPAGMLRFDIDQTGMNDRFDGGNSTRPGCVGTYRNGCDVRCGLDYSAPGNYVDPYLHGTGENAGVEVVLVPGYSKDASSLCFHFTSFTSGLTFAFDCDTDGGPTSGDAHAGMLVRVTTTGSGVLSGVLQVDPLQPDRAFVHFP